MHTIHLASYSSMAVTVNIFCFKDRVDINSGKIAMFIAHKNRLYRRVSNSYISSQPVRGRRSTRTFSCVLSIPTVGKKPPFGMQTCRAPTILPFLVKKTFKQINKLICNTTFIYYLHKMCEINAKCPAKFCSNESKYTGNTNMRKCHCLSYRM
jgi:hypothetical protein